MIPSKSKLQKMKLEKMELRLQMMPVVIEIYLLLKEYQMMPWCYKHRFGGGHRLRYLFNGQIIAERIHNF